MKKIQDLVDNIDEEIEDAKKYAEMYLYEKAAQNQKRAKYYNEMSLEELKHATYLHDIAVEEIEKLEKVYKAPEEMKEEWNKAHIRYADRVAWIKQMLVM